MCSWHHFSLTSALSHGSLCWDRTSTPFPLGGLKYLCYRGAGRKVAKNVLCSFSAQGLLPPSSSAGKWVRQVNTASWTFGLFTLPTRAPSGRWTGSLELIKFIKFPSISFRFSFQFRPQNLRLFCAQIPPSSTLSDGHQYVKTTFFLITPAPQVSS